MRGLLLGVLATGCSVGELDGDLDRSMLERVARFEAMEHVNQRPLPSELGELQIDCYVDGDAAGYRAIHPETAGSNVTIEPGTVIVRAVLSPDGRPATLTVMGKGPPGFDPTFGDWWFAVTDPLGVPRVEDGVVMVGALAGCHDCHRDRARDDFLFGVPAGALR